MLAKRAGYAILASAATLAATALALLLGAKTLPDWSFGYWQLYLFYTSFVGVFHLGWVDGAYLRWVSADGGPPQQGRLSRQLAVFAGFQMLIACVLVAAILASPGDADRRVVLLGAVASLVLSNLRGLVYAAFQAAARLREYARFSVADRAVFMASIVAVSVFRNGSFAAFVCADLLGISVGLTFALLRLRLASGPHVTGEPWSVVDVARDAKQSIRRGFPLMAANIAGMLTIGIVRWAIELEWGIATFGQVSFFMSIVNIVLGLLGPISLALLPSLARLEPAKLRELYPRVRALVAVLSISGLLLYFPGRLAVDAFFPTYSGQWVTLLVLFPVTIFSLRIVIFTNSFLKAMGREVQMLMINTVSVVVSGVLAYLSVAVVHSLMAAVASMLVAAAVRATLAEWVLGSALDISTWRTDAIELAAVAAFLASNLVLPPWVGLVAWVATIAGAVLVGGQRLRGLLRGAGVHSRWLGGGSEI